MYELGGKMCPKGKVKSDVTGREKQLKRGTSRRGLKCSKRRVKKELNTSLLWSGRKKSWGLKFRNCTAEVRGFFTEQDGAPPRARGRERSRRKEEAVQGMVKKGGAMKGK